MSLTIDDVAKATPLNIVKSACRLNKYTGALKGSQITVGATSDADSKDATGNVARSVRSGRHMVRRTIARLGRKSSWGQYKIEYFAKLLFLQDPLTRQTVNNIIIPKLELTLNGLVDNITINVAEQVTNFNDDGVVARQTTGLIHLRIQPFTKTYRDEIRDGNEEAYQNLKMQATSTVIHEATHKFANTVDYCYLDPMNDLKPKTAFNDGKLALVNADSYAWFVCGVGLKEG